MQPKPLVLPQGGFEKTRPNKHRAVLIWQDRVVQLLGSPLQKQNLSFITGLKLKRTSDRSQKNSTIIWKNAHFAE